MELQHQSRRRRGEESRSAGSQSDDGDLPDYTKPRTSAPELPDDLTGIDDEELMQLLTAITNWHSYGATVLAAAEVAHKRAEDGLTYAKAVALVESWSGGKDDRVRISEAQRDSDENVLAARQEVLDRYSARKRLEVRVQAFTDASFVVSRELTRRLGMEPQSRRERRWGGS